MQRIATGNMDLLLLSLISLLLVAGGGGSWSHASSADAAAPNSDSETPMAYWQAVLPGIPMPPAISDLLAPHSGDEVAHHVENMHEHQFINGPIRKLGPRLSGGQIFQKNDLHANDDKKVMYLHKPPSKEDEKKATFSYESLSEENKKKVTYNLYSQEDQKKNVDKKKVIFLYKPQVRDLKKKVTFSYNPQNKDIQKNLIYSYMSLSEEDEKEVTFSYKPLGEENQKKATYSLYSQEDQKKATFSYKPHQKVDQKKVTFSYKPQVEDLEKKVTFSYKPQVEDLEKKVTFSYNPQNEDIQKKVTYSYMPLSEEDEKKVTFSYKPISEENQKRVTHNLYSQEDQKKVTFSYKPHQNVDQKKVTFSYKPQVEDLEKKVTFSYDPQNEDTQKKVTYSYKPLSGDEPYDEATGKRSASIKGEGHDEHAHHDHSHGHSHDQQASNSDKLADVFFLEDVLRLGSVITPTIPRTTSLPTLLRRKAAGSIPFSTNRLADILAMFAPSSLAIAAEVRWVLEKCEDVAAAPLTSADGETKAFCATSVEDLVELPMAVLGTRHVRAFSGDMPVEAASAAPRGRYRVAALRRISDESSEMVTCHDMTYPYAVFYCHAAGPASRAYLVTLASEDGAAPATMEAVAVCHLDTSRWSPQHPFLRALRAEPGDVAACHFLPKSSIVWAMAAGEQGEGQHADQ